MGDRKPLAQTSGGADPSLENRLWQVADALRGNMDAAEYKHVVLGLVFLRYVSDAFDEQRARLEARRADRADAGHRDEDGEGDAFRVPPEARWARIQAEAGQPDIGRRVDAAMAAIERGNPSLEGVLPQEYARPGLDAQRVGRIIDLISDIGPGDAKSRSKDILGRVYESFLSQFARAEGRQGGQFHTPRCVAQILVEMLAPCQGRVYDPCCGSGGVFVQSASFIEARGGRIGQVSVYGQESNYSIWRLARMNLAMRGIDAQIAHGDSLHADAFPDLKADYVLAHPPFNDSDWRDERLAGDRRWKYGAPPAGNANFAWAQHCIHHLAPAGMAGLVLANGSMSSSHAGEGEIRRALVEADLIDCMVALPGQLFDSTQIPACLWLVARDKENGRWRDRRGQVLFIDARELGVMRDRGHRELTGDEIRRVAGTYHAWRGDRGGHARYADVAGFCKAATSAEIARHGHVLTPGRYVGAEAALDDGEAFDAKMKRLTTTLREQTQAAARLDEAIRRNLEELGYGGE